MARLYRAAAVERPDFGHGTCWTTRLEHARFYTQSPGFGGPRVYEVDVEVDPLEVLDLRDDSVGTLAALGFDPYSQGEGEWLPGEIIRIGKLTARHWPDHKRWWVFHADEPDGGVCWLYLGREPLAAVPVSAEEGSAP